MWASRLEVEDLRNIQRAVLELDPGLNVLVGRNAQGKTSILEALGLVARGRSFRTEQTAAVIRMGAVGLRASAAVVDNGLATTLKVEVGRDHRALHIDGRRVTPREYHGRLEALVYSTDRLEVVRGPMRSRRQFIDRAAAALWPSYRQLLREYERVVMQRNAALATNAVDLDAWNERLIELGADLRLRRAHYVTRLGRWLSAGFAPKGETYDIRLCAPNAEDLQAHAQGLREEMNARLRDERRLGRSLVGPQRDRILMLVDREDSGERASAGQVRSLLLALTLAMLEVYRQERGTAAVVLLDDLDSELDEERANLLCAEVSRRAQTLVTTAHVAWGREVARAGRLFVVEGGAVQAA